MSRLYAATFEGVAVSAQVDFFEIAPADDKPIAIHYCSITNSSDFGDAQEEGLRIKIIRGHATGGSGGSTPTPVPLSPVDTAAGAVVEANNTTIASVGTPVDLLAETFNVRTGFYHVPTPECRIICSQAQGLLVVRLMAAPADAITLSGTVVFEELA